MISFWESGILQGTTVENKMLMANQFLNAGGRVLTTKRQMWIWKNRIRQRGGVAGRLQIYTRPSVTFLLEKGTKIYQIPSLLFLDYLGPTIYYLEISYFHKAFFLKKVVCSFIFLQQFRIIWGNCLSVVRNKKWVYGSAWAGD